jgi:hypothetical protein
VELGEQLARTKRQLISLSILLCTILLPVSCEWNNSDTDRGRLLDEDSHRMASWAWKRWALYTTHLSDHCLSQRANIYAQAMSSSTSPHLMPLYNVLYYSLDDKVLGLKSKGQPKLACTIIPLADRRLERGGRASIGILITWGGNTSPAVGSPVCSLKPSTTKTKQ